jgi:hypothetical protein
MALQTVMQQRDRDMQIITGALVTDDWVTIARVAPQIARHPQPPISEKMRILGWLGSKAGTFRTFDNEVHDAATSMARAATQADGKAVIAAFAKVQLGCLGCHETFRKPFRDHFHAER